MWRKDWIMSLLTVILLIGSLSSEKACSTKPVSVSFALDGTNYLKQEQWEQMSHFIQGVTGTIPEGGDVSCAYVNAERVKIAKFEVQKDKHDIKDVLEPADWKPSGHSISASALSQEVNKHFSISNYKRKAEIFFLLVSDLTTLLGIPPVLLKKKIFVIVFGTRIPNELQSLPSSGDHIHLIKDTNDVTSVIDLVSKQLCKDSSFKCDVDRYMEGRSIKCQSCMYVCSNITVEQPIACKQRCPYILNPPRQYAVKITKEKVLDEVSWKERDSRKNTIVSVVLSIFGFVFICFTIGLVFACHKKELLCFTHNGEQRRGMPLRDTVPVPETGDHDEQALDVEAAEPLVSSDQGTDRVMAPRDYLKNVKEAEMNEEVFADPRFIDIQVGHQLGTAG